MVPIHLVSFPPLFTTALFAVAAGGEEVFGVEFPVVETGVAAGTGTVGVVSAVGLAGGGVLLPHPPKNGTARLLKRINVVCINFILNTLFTGVQLFDQMPAPRQSDSVTCRAFADFKMGKFREGEAPAEPHGRKRFP